MNATLTHVVFRVTGEPLQLAAFDARLKLLFAEHGIADGVDEQHAADLLHYDLKVAGGIPFPPFALASADLPATILSSAAPGDQWVAQPVARQGFAEQGFAELTAIDVRDPANGIAAGRGPTAGSPGQSPL